jgi:putative ABC transport system permease protein
MSSLALKELLAHKRRLLGTFLAVFLGIAFLSGTLVLGDTMRANFDRLFTNANAGTDVVVRHASNLGIDPGEPASQRGLIATSLVDRVRAVDGVAAAEPYVEGYGQLIDRHGDRVGGNGPPTLAGSWIEDRDLNPYRLVEGRAPRADDEVVINRGAAKAAGLHVGDLATVETPEPVRVRVVGISTFGTADGLGRVTFTAFTLHSAQEHLLHRDDRVVSISVKAEPGVSQDALLQRIERSLPRGTEAITGVQRTTENTDEINAAFLDLFTTFLTVFAGIALVVATFSIYNTFSIIVAQRTRQAALLRAIGAGRRQILTAVVVEAVVVGVIASAAGVVGGLGMAAVLKVLLDAIGFALPAGGLVLHPSVVLIGLSVGVVVTLVAGLGPAVKASRVAPLAALRDAAVEDGRASARRALAGAALVAIGAAIVLAAVLPGSPQLGLAGLGALCTLVGVVVFGPVVAGPVAGIIGAPARRLRGVTAALGRENAMRNPRRTSGTAAALMVGVAVVTLFTIFAASLKAAIDDSVTGSFTGDLVISSGRFGGSGLSPQLARDINRLPAVADATGLGTGRALVGRSTKTVTVVDPPRLAPVLDLDVVSGSLASLDASHFAVSQRIADDRGWRVGTAVPVTLPDNTTTPLVVGTIFKSRDITGDYLLSRATWAPHAVQNLDTTVLIRLAPGVTVASGRRAVEQAARPFGAPRVEDRSQYAASAGAFVDMMLGVVYVLLALAIAIALMGIANTLSLSMYERTRELGLLRAIGESRRQVRSMIRWESVIIATFGAAGGLGVGAFLGWALVKAASGGSGEMVTPTFTAPIARLLVVLFVGALAGVLAAIRPARRAARLPVLQAVATT